LAGVTGIHTYLQNPNTKMSSYKGFPIFFFVDNIKGCRFLLIYAMNMCLCIILAPHQTNIVSYQAAWNINIGIYNICTSVFVCGCTGLISTNNNVHYIKLLCENNIQIKTNLNLKFGQRIIICSINFVMFRDLLQNNKHNHYKKYYKNIVFNN